jgi:microcystin-dependent protein
MSKYILAILLFFSAEFALAGKHKIAVPGKADVYVPTFESDGKTLKVDNLSGKGSIPAGSIIAYAGASVPNGWLLCDGSSYAISTYQNLSTALGTTYNTQRNQSTGSPWSSPGGGNFRVPDFRGVFLRGTGTSSGYAATTLGTTQDDATAKNSLANAASSISGTTGDSPSLAHDHYINGNQFRWNAVATGSAVQAVDGGLSGTNGSTRITEGANQSLVHAHSVSGTAVAQVISSLDTETRPVNVGVNYIIKY